MKQKGLAVEVYEKLRKDVVEYGRTGVMLTEQQFCALYGASRTPVHEAFSRLCSEGILIKHPKRGYTLSLINRKDNLMATMEYRFCLEMGVVEKIIRTASDEELEGLRNTLPENEEVTFGQFEACSRKLHLTMAELSGYTRVISALQAELDKAGSVMPQDAIISNNIVRRLNRSHAALVEALVKRDFTAALEALRRELLEEPE